MIEGWMDDVIMMEWLWMDAWMDGVIDSDWVIVMDSWMVWKTDGAIDNDRVIDSDRMMDWWVEWWTTGWSDGLMDIAAHRLDIYWQNLTLGVIQGTQAGWRWRNSEFPFPSFDCEIHSSLMSRLEQSNVANSTPTNWLVCSVHPIKDAEELQFLIKLPSPVAILIKSECGASHRHLSISSEARVIIQYISNYSPRYSLCSLEHLNIR